MFFSVELLASDCLFEILGVEKNNLLSSFANRQGKLNFSQVISQRAMCFAQLWHYHPLKDFLIDSTTGVSLQEINISRMLHFCFDDLLIWEAITGIVSNGMNLLIFVFRTGWLSKRSIDPFLPRVKKSTFQMTTQFLLTAMEHFVRYVSLISLTWSITTLH